ncbi:hypothetical protein HY990_00275 [Candidatus Micrarchaeota archaeon]|nr:hypothetical protein [Candidatus Micrarchaeota archaeon]
MTGIALGACLLQSLEISGRFWPYPRAIQHTILPLLAAASVGAVYGMVLELLARAMSGPGLLMRNFVLSYFIGAVLAMVSTPMIIVRSSAFLRHKGLRPEIRPTEEDPKWRL